MNHNLSFAPIYASVTQTHGGAPRSVIKHYIEHEKTLHIRRSYLYQTKINHQSQAKGERWPYRCRTLCKLALEQRTSFYKQNTGHQF